MLGAVRDLYSCSCSYGEDDEHQFEDDDEDEDEDEFEEEERASPLMSRTTLGLVLLTLLAITLRVSAVLWLQAHRTPFTYEHGEIAENLLAGRGFSVTFLGTSGPTSQQAPFYPSLLAAAYWLFGVRSSSAFLAVQLLQCLAGAATCLCAAWLAWSIWPGRRAVGWLAGLIAVVHPVHVYAVMHLQVAVWATLLLTLLVAIALSPRWRGWQGAVLLGAVGGGLLLIEPIFAIVMPIVAAAFVMKDARRSGPTVPIAAGAAEHSRASGWESRTGRVALPILRAAAMAASAALVIAPWMWRNYRVHGEVVFVKSTFGYALWQGNNPISWGTDKIPKPSVAQILREPDRLPGGGTLADQYRAAWEARHETLYIDDVLLKPGKYAEFAGLSEPERSRLLGRRAWDFIREQPFEYAQLCAQRLRYFLLFDETNPRAAHAVYRAATMAWLALTLAGLATTCRQWRTLWPLYAIVAAVMLFHTLTIVSARFRLPIEPLTFVWCAAAVAGVGGALERAAGRWPFVRHG